jgi:1-acyl-sn-glycerol-3-phosphate acyltransferase
LRPLATRFFPLAVEGAERLPARGPYIIAANHHNYLDGVVLGLAVPEPIAFVVMPRVYRATALHPPFHDRIGSIPINLERPDVGGLRRALKALEGGAIVGIFPEGPFSHRGRLEAGLPGVGLLALRARVAVVPAAIRGTFEALRDRRFYLPRRTPITVRFGLPRRFSGEADQARPARAAATRRIMDDIAALLATSPHGPRDAGATHR